MFRKNVVEKTEPHILFSITFCENCAVRGIMLKNMVILIHDYFSMMQRQGGRIAH